jgi:hypothetical protein
MIRYSDTQCPARKGGYGLVIEPQTSQVWGSFNFHPKVLSMAAKLRDEHQGLHRCLPLRRGMFGFRKLGDVVAGVLERDKPVSARGNAIGSSRGATMTRSTTLKSAAAPAAKSRQGK